MGDSDGSSAAAHSAQLPDNTRKNKGALARMFNAFSKPSPVAVNGAPVEVQTTSPAHGMINLRQKRVQDVAIPKADIVAMPVETGLDELVQVFRDSGLTRIPIYEGTLDAPIGFAHMKDLALRHGFTGDNADFDLAKLLRPLLFVPPSMSIGVLLSKMQAERRHMALVIDEYGGVDGLLTIEDLIEQVIGEIEDEHDQEDDTFFTEEKPGQYIALAKTPLEEFETAIGHSLTNHEEVDEEEIDTLGGLVFMLSGKIPARGEVVQHPDGFEFEVIDADPRRIKRLRVRLQGRAD